MQINKGCIIEFFPNGRFWQLIYKENFRCTRLMRRSLQVVIRQKFVKWMLWSPANQPRLMPKEFQLLVYILHFLGVEMIDWMNLLCWYIFIINGMRSLTERTILHCVESYLYYIILVDKNIFWGVKRGRKWIDNKPICIPCRKYKIYIYAPSIYSNPSQQHQLNQRHTSYQNITYTPNQLIIASSLLCLLYRIKTTRHQLDFFGPSIVAI
jgi:hypothetical protein